MQSFWDERYAQPEYIYGTEPNVYFRQQLDALPPGKLLLPAEGEGRNAVYAASQGWQVTAFDLSTEGRRKALALAAQQGVEIDYHIMGFDAMDWEENTFDAIALIYAHQPRALRSLAYPRLLHFLRPGGTLILEGFSKNQLGKSSGGPQALELLFSQEELREDFAALSSQALEETEIVLDEGRYHAGAASVIRLLGKK